jgi:hypothetical protein
MGKKQNVYKVLVGKHERKRPQRGRNHTWRYVIKMVLKAVGWGDADWSRLAQNRDMCQALMTTVMNLWAPYNFLTS